jgi:hypothetical protein
MTPHSTPPTGGSRIVKYLWLIEACGDDRDRLAELALVLAGASIAAKLVDVQRLPEYREAVFEIERRMVRLLKC